MSLPIEEQWHPISGYEGYYEASDQGRIRSVDRTVACSDGRQLKWRGRVLRPTVRRDNVGARCTVALSKDGKPRTQFVHFLVLSAFIGPRPPGADVCHSNGDGTDNRLSNLRYDTRSENLRDAVRHGTHHAARKTHCPRNHPLVTPNLVPGSAKRGGRDCLACDRTRCNVRVAKRKNQPFDFQKWADAHYARIMEDHA